MKMSVGIDIVEIADVADSLRRYGARFAARVFTDGERRRGDKSGRPSEFLAARFAAKEAAFKALGRGIGQGVGWKDVEVVEGPFGRPEVRLSGGAGELARRQGLATFDLSISHSVTHAVAVVVGLGIASHGGRGA